MTLQSSQVKKASLYMQHGGNQSSRAADPVEITISPDGKKIIVKPVSEDYLAMARLPAYSSSSLVQNAAAASRLIVTTSDYLASIMTSGAEKFESKTKPQKPIIFNPATHQRVRKINDLTASARDLSTRTVGQATKIAQNVGATLARRKDKQRAKEDATSDEYKPGLLNKSMIAFSTVFDSLATSGKHLLETSGSAATSVVGYRYGDDARQVAAELTRSVTNVGLVYIDVTGVSRRAVIRSVAKGMLVGKVKGGGQIIVGDGDGGQMPENLQVGEAAGPGGEPPKYTPGDYKPSDPSEKYS
jgi:spartin